MDGREQQRTIREEPSFAYCADRLRADVARLDDLLGHLKWRLSRDPTSYSFALPGRETRVAFTEELHGAPVLRVFFSIEVADVVALRWVEGVEDAPPLGFDDFL